MQLNIFFAAAIFSELVFATYDIKLYKSKGCFGLMGARCLNLAAGACCSRLSIDEKKGSPAPLSLWQSANYVENTSQKANGNDQVKIYSQMGNEACGLPSTQSATCSSGSSKSITGAAVFVVVPTGSGRSSRHSRMRREPEPITGMAQPDEFFYEEGKTEYSLPIKSPRGVEYENLTLEADQIAHMKKFGKRSVFLV